MKNLLIILYLFLVGFTYQPEINYTCQIDQSDKDSLESAILNMPCDTTEPVVIAITEYYKAGIMSQIVGWPVKGDSIKGSILYKGKSKNIKSNLTARGFPVPPRNIKDVEQAFAKAVWKIICKGN